MDPQALESEARSAIAGASTLDELDDARVRYLGRRSDLKQALREVREAETGSVLNTLREGLEQAGGLVPPAVDEATVATRRTAAADVGLQHNDTQGRIRQEELVGRPQPGVPAADDRHVRLGRPVERR